MSRDRARPQREAVKTLSPTRARFDENEDASWWLVDGVWDGQSQAEPKQLCDPAATHRFFVPVARKLIPRNRLVTSADPPDPHAIRARRWYEFDPNELHGIGDQEVRREFRLATPMAASVTLGVLERLDLP